jgi:hypothetical protein
MTTLRLSLGRRIQPPLKLTVAVSVVAWVVAWFVEAPLSDWLTFSVFGLERGSHFGEAIARGNDQRTPRRPGLARKVASHRRPCPYVRLFWTRVLPDDCQAIMPPSRFQTFL